ncbi:Hypothetical protein CINCED_3A024181 [Cinara cedri]|uniref:Uncharacterized protein n=1 Tax=Cinara cedri TaxID=506608 RepID=A0A5E4MQT5_9HEMI|nr:Hypothetical protein CINCED_3A024181 [Cinara cedri]
MKKSDSLLVHAGAGRFDQAAIAIALHMEEDKLQSSVHCLAKDVNFLKIDKFDTTKNITVHRILLNSLFDAEFKSVDKKEVVRLLNEGIETGTVNPLPISVYSESQIPVVFRFFESGKHIGKFVLKIRDEKLKAIIKPTTKLFTSIPRSYMNSEKIYILVGDLKGFDFELHDWLIVKGTKKLMLAARNGITTDYQASI